MCVQYRKNEVGVEDFLGDEMWTRRRGEGVEHARCRKIVMGRPTQEAEAVAKSHAP